MHLVIRLVKMIFFVNEYDKPLGLNLPQLEEGYAIGRRIGGAWRAYRSTVSMRHQ